MTTILESPLRREIRIDDKPYTLTINPHGFSLVEKRRRKGVERNWKDFVGEDHDSGGDSAGDGAGDGAQDGNGRGDELS